MNVPGIRKALETLQRHSKRSLDDLHAAVATVGLRACDELERVCREHRCAGCPYCASAKRDIRVIADILREAGVEVEK